VSAKQKVNRERHTGDFTIKLISGLLFAAFVLYCGFNLYNSLDNPLRTTRAAAVAVLETGDARGYIAREERVIPGAFGLVVPELQSGARAAAGQAVAVGYSDGTDSRSVAQVRELRSRIEQLNTVAATTPDTRAKQSRAAAESLVSAVLHRDFAAERKLAIAAESLVMSAAEPEAVRAEISALEAELKALTAQISAGVTVTAAVSGVFAAELDGYENISPDAMLGLVPSGLDALFSYPAGGAGAARLVTGTHWSLALVVSDADAARLLEQSVVTVRLNNPVSAEFEMKIEEIGRSEGGERVAVLSCASGLSKVLNARTVTAEVLFGETSGIRVPKEAVRLEPRSAEDASLERFVYVAEGQVARRIRVTILREFGDAYIVKGEVIGNEATGAASRLRDGAEIIVKANNLYDGKVIR
jgi:hypothetical protein